MEIAKSHYDIDFIGGTLLSMTEKFSVLKHCKGVLKEGKMYAIPSSRG